MKFRNIHIPRDIPACFVMAAALSSCGSDVPNDPPATKTIQTFSEMVGLTSVSSIELPGDSPYRKRRLPVNIDPQLYKMELSGDIERHSFCQTILSELQGSDDSIIGILQGVYNPEIGGLYDGQFFPFPDIPKIVETLNDVLYERLPWRNIEEDVGEIFYRKVNPHKTYYPSGRILGPPIRNMDITLESFLSDLPDNYTGYPVFQIYEFEDANYILFRTKGKTQEEIRQLDQNYAPSGARLPSNTQYEGRIDISYNWGRLEGFGENVSFAEFLGNDGIYYLNAKTGRRFQNTLSVISVHFFDPSIKPGEKAYSYEEVSGPADNPITRSIAHSGPVSAEPICEIKIRFKSPPKL